MPAEASGTAAPFNFSRAGLVANEQVRTLRTLDEQFARNLTHTLGAWLRTNIGVAPLPAEQGVYSKFAEKTAAGAYVLPLRMEALQVRALLSLDLKLAPTIIDLLLGGSGRTGGAERELTEIEEAVLGSVLEIVLREWTAAWMPFDVEFVAGVRERGGHSQRPMLLQERVFCCRFQVTLAELTGELEFCMPTAAVTSTLRNFAQRRDRQRQRKPEDRAKMTHRLRAAEVHASLHFPAVRLRAAHLRAMKTGTLLALPLARSSPAELRVGGVPVFRAVPVRSGDHRAAQIVHVLESNTAGGETS